MSVLFANFAGSTLAFPISPTDLTATLTSGAGALFPSPGAGQYFSMTFANSAATLREIVHVTARSGDIVTIVRAQEGTTALGWNAGDLAQNRLTAGDLAYLEGLFSQALGGVLTGTLPNPGMAAGAAATNVGAVGGDLTGTLPNPTIKASVGLTGFPTAPTMATNTSNTTIATTAFANPGGSIGVPGYRRNADGTIEQWVFIAVGPTGTTWTFPIAFPNQVLAISAVTVGTPLFVDAPLIPTFDLTFADVDYFNTVTGNVFIRALGN